MKGNFLLKLAVISLCAFSFQASAENDNDSCGDSKQFTIVAVKGDKARAATYCLKEGKTTEDVEKLLHQVDMLIRNDSGIVERRMGR